MNVSRLQSLSRLKGTGGVAVAPSLLASDFARLGEEIGAVEAAGADLIHVDVMDGQFVPNLTVGVPVVASVRRATELPVDVHLMITDPADYIDPFLDAGADILTFHIEAVPEPVGLLERIRSRGALAGLVLKPATPVSALADFVAHVDMILVMSVEPGFGGQAFMTEVLPKVTECRQLLGDSGLVEIDGGIDATTVGNAVGAGAQVLVAGSAVFGSDDYAGAIAGLRRPGSKS